MGMGCLRLLPTGPDFIADIAGYPTTYVVDREGNIIGALLIGNVKDQIDTLRSRGDQIQDRE